jgi:hypothetical protein
LRVLSENQAEIWELALTGEGDDARLSDQVRIGKLKEFGTDKNKGFEGLEVLPAELSPDAREWQLAAHEAEPRKLVFLDSILLNTMGMAEIP